MNDQISGSDIIVYVSEYSSHTSCNAKNIQLPVISLSANVTLFLLSLYIYADSANTPIQ